jgi:hypothetical protein
MHDIRSVVLDILQQITHTKSTVSVGMVSQGGAVAWKSSQPFAASRTSCKRWRLGLRPARCSFLWLKMRLRRGRQVLPMYTRSLKLLIILYILPLVYRVLLVICLLI